MIDPDDLERYRSFYRDMVGGEVMVWTGGGHYFRGILVEITDAGFLVLEGVSCTLAGERGERDRVYVDPDKVDAAS